MMMRALPDLMRARKDLKVVMVGGDGVSYGAAPRQGGNWREVMLREVGEKLTRPGGFPGRGRLLYLPRNVSPLRRHIYLTYPFVASWSCARLSRGCP